MDMKKIMAQMPEEVRKSFVDKEWDEYLNQQLIKAQDEITKHQEEMLRMSPKQRYLFMDEITKRYIFENLPEKFQESQS